MVNTMTQTNRKIDIWKSLNNQIRSTGMNGLRVNMEHNFINTIVLYKNEQR